MIRNVSWSSYVWDDVIYYRVSWTSSSGACSVATPDKAEFTDFLREMYEESVA